jgi:hypothetical protein
VGASILPFFVNDPRHWRARAEESRALAETLTDPVARMNMLEVAAAYERMAERAENHPIRTPRGGELTIACSIGRTS